MREIKFRVWKKSENRMIDWRELCEKDILRDVLDGIYLESVMQSTGLKDKNGKEIYEGDIVKGKFIRYLPEKKIFKIISAVIFEHGMFRIKCRYSKWSKKFYYDSFPYSHGKGEYLKIIGNIFENPELQEAGK